MSPKRKFRAPSLPREQRLEIAMEYVQSDMTLQETAAKYGIKRQTLWKWVDSFSLRDKMLSLQDEKEPTIMPKKHTEAPLTEQEARDRIRDLELRLAWSERKVLALNTLIDIAEEQGYSIRKKSGAKQ